MGTLEDQLKQWQKSAGPAPAPSSKAPSKGGSKSTAAAPAPLSKRAAKKKPLLQTIRRDEPSAPVRSEPAPPPKPLTDADLFAAAIEGVSADAVLDKFAAAPTVKVRGQTLQPSAPKTDTELFADFVGTVLPKGAPSPKKPR